VDECVVTKGYGRLATVVMENPDITINAKALYAYLICRISSGMYCYPSVARIMKDLGIKSKLSFRDYRDELIVKGLLKVKIRKSKSGRNMTNYYYPIQMVLERYLDQHDEAEVEAE
jgi:hypothetical protein